MPSKPAKYGLKILVATATYYGSNIELYTGKDDERGMYVVMKLTAHIQGSGRNVMCDIFFTSLKLVRVSFERIVRLEQYAAIEKMCQNN